MIALLSYGETCKTLRLRQVSFLYKGSDYPFITYVLKSEKSFECIDLRQLSHLYYDHLPHMLEVFNECCPNLSKFILDIYHFSGFSPGWDRAYRASLAAALNTPFDFARVAQPQDVGNIILSNVASCSNLRHLELHFSLDPSEILLLHPGQCLQATREIYDELWWRRNTTPLPNLDVAFNTSANNIYGYHCLGRMDEKIGLTIKCRVVDIDSNHKGYPVVTLDDNRCGKAIECRQKLLSRYGCRIWSQYLGLSTYKRFHGERSLTSGLIAQVALIPTLFKPNELKRAQRRGEFCAS